MSGISGDKAENSMGSWDYWIVKTDAAGNIQWQNTIGGAGTEFLNSLVQTADSGYFFGGWSDSNASGDKTENSNGGKDYWAVKTDNTGNIQWEKTIGGGNDDWLLDLQQCADGSYILGGWSASNISGDKTENCIGGPDYWIIKLFPDTITSVPNYQLPITDSQIFPNPSSGIFQITFPSSSNQKTNYTLAVINTLGQTVFTSPPAPLQRRGESSALPLDLSFLPKGIYVLRLCISSGKINDGVSAPGSKFVIE